MPNPYDPQYASIRQKIAYYAQKYGIDANLAIWQLWTENKFQSSGCSNKGACGIAQFIPSTAADYGVNRENIDSSLDGYGRYMRDLVKFFGGDTTKAVAAYNTGAGNIQKGVYPAETRNYLAVIGSGLASIGSQIAPLFGASGSITSSITSAVPGVGDVLGLGDLKSYFFEEKLQGPLERFKPFIETPAVSPQNRILIATVIILVIIAFTWREF
jgi:hypothetical protein